MDFKLTEEQQMLQDTVDRLVADTYGFEQWDKSRQTELGFNRDFWKKLAELGLTALPFAEEFGGLDGSGVETMLIMTALGRGLCLEPYLQSVIYAGGLIEQLGTDAQKTKLLPGIASADLLAAVALEEPQSHYHLNDVQTKAEQKSGKWLLTGRKVAVVGGHCADLILVSARISGNTRDEKGVGLFLLDPMAPGVRRRKYALANGQEGCELYLDAAEVAESRVLGPAEGALPALRYQQGRAIAAQCAQALGSMQEACNLTLDYLKTRQQFGVPIGQFQALQHRMVDMSTELELATSMTMLAACAADQPDSVERSKTLAAAKYMTVKGGRFIAEQSIQLHGGIGMTWEYALSHHAKQLILFSHQMGDDDHHLQAYATLLEK